MIESLRELCALLGKGGVTAEETANALGTTTSSSSISIEVNPSDAAFSNATVVRLPEGDGASHVELTLAQPVELAELTRAFGESRTPPRIHAGDASTRTYRSGACRIIATLTPDDRVQEITLQSDVA